MRLKGQRVVGPKAKSKLSNGSHQIWPNSRAEK